MRKPTWWRRILWWFGYHGVYQMYWLWKGDKKAKDIRLIEWVYIIMWITLFNLIARLII